MSIRRYWPAGPIALTAAVALAALPFVARAESGAPAAPQAAASGVAGWGEFAESLRTLPDRMLAKLPVAMRSDPQVQQEVARLALEAVSTTTLEAIGGDGDAPVFLPSIGQILNVGQPNADTIYRGALITPGASYRIRGLRGSLRLTVLAQVVPQGSAGAGAREHLHLSDLKADAQGRYDVLLSDNEAAGS